MSRSSASGWRFLTFAALLALGFVIWNDRAAQSFQADEAKPPRWEYSSVTVEALSLQAKLSELGVAGWDVFSVMPYDSVVSAGNNNQAHVTVEKYEVSSRRPLKP